MRRRKGTTMTSGPRPRAHDVEDTRTSTGESLEELTERTAEVMDDARKQVNRARETFRDQIAPSGSGADDLGYAHREPDHELDHEPGRGTDREAEHQGDRETAPEPEPAPEPDAEGDDTKAAWPK